MITFSLANLDSNVQVLSSATQLAQFVKGLSDYELQGWEGPAQKAVKEGDWEDLMLLIHCTFFFDPTYVGSLTYTATAKLQEFGTSNQMQDSDSTEQYVMFTLIYLLD
jgi:hypothetical protein